MSNLCFPSSLSTKSSFFGSWLFVNCIIFFLFFVSFGAMDNWTAICVPLCTLKSDGNGKAVCFLPLRNCVVPYPAHRLHCLAEGQIYHQGPSRSSLHVNHPVVHFEDDTIGSLEYQSITHGSINGKIQGSQKFCFPAIPRKTRTLQDGMSTEICQSVHCTVRRKLVSVILLGPETPRDVNKHE